MTSVCAASTDQTKGSQNGVVGDDAFPRERWVQALQSLAGDNVLEYFSREIPSRENTDAWDCILSVVKCLTFRQIQHILLRPFSKLRNDPQRVATLLSLPAKECVENMLASAHVFVSACYFNLCDIPSWRAGGFSSTDALKFLIEGVDSGDQTTRRLCPLYLALCSSRKPHTLLGQYICDAQWLDKKKAYVDLFMSFAGNYDVENIVLGELMRAEDDSVVLKQLLQEMPVACDNHFCVPSWCHVDVMDRGAELHSARNTFCRVLLRLTRGKSIGRSGIHADLEDSHVSSSKCLDQQAPNTAKVWSREISMGVNLATETRGNDGCKEDKLRLKKHHRIQGHQTECVNQEFTHTESVCGDEVGRNLTTPVLAKVRGQEISVGVDLARNEDGCEENELRPRKHQRIQGHHGERVNQKSPSGYESPESSKLFQNVQSFLHELCSQDELDIFHNAPGTLISKGNSMLCTYLKKLMSERKKRTITGAGIEKCVLQLGPLIGNFLGKLRGWSSTMDYSNAKLLARILHAFFSVLLTAKRTFECLWDDKFGNHMGSIHWKIALLRLCEHPSENEDLGKLLPDGITTALNNWSEVIETIAQKRQHHKIVFLSIQKLECKSNILACFEDAASMTSSQTCAFAYLNALKNMLHSSDPLNEMPRPIFESLSCERTESKGSVKSSSVEMFCDHALLVFQRCESSLEARGAKEKLVEPTIRLITAIIASLMLYTHTRRTLLHGGMIRAFATLLARESLKVGITVNASIAVSYAFTRSFEEEDAVSKNILCQNLLDSELLPVTAKYLSGGDHRVDPRLVANGLEIARYAIDVISVCEYGPTKESLVETLSKSKMYTAVAYLLASHTFVQMVEGDDNVFLDLYTAATQLSHLYREFDVNLNDMDEIVLAKRLVLMARNHVDAERRKEVFGFMRHDLALKSDCGSIRQFLSKVLKVKR